MISNKMYLVYLFIFLTIYTYAKDIKPITVLKTSGIVSNFVKDGSYLYVATDAGIVDIINLNTQTIVSQIKFPPMKSVTGEFIPARVHSVDRFEDKTLLVTSSINAYRNIWIHSKNRLKKIIDSSKKLMPKRAYFTKKGKIVLGTFGSDITLYEVEEGFSIYKNHISQSTMGGMILSSDKSTMIVSDESGTVKIIDIQSGKTKETFNSEHVDNVYNVAYKNSILITAGQDRRVGVYRKDREAYHLKSDFLVYCVGLSPSGELGAYSDGFAHDLQLFSTKNGAKKDRLVGHYATPNKIVFVSENTIISTGDEDKVFFWVID